MHGTGERGIARPSPRCDLSPVGALAPSPMWGLDSTSENLPLSQGFVICGPGKQCRSKEHPKKSCRDVLLPLNFSRFWRQPQQSSAEPLSVRATFLPNMRSLSIYIPPHNEPSISRSLFPQLHTNYLGRCFRRRLGLGFSSCANVQEAKQPMATVVLFGIYQFLAFSS